MARAIIALGSNLGETEAHVREAADEIGQLPGVSVLAMSRLASFAPAYRSDQPDFTNAVAVVDVDWRLAGLGGDAPAGLASSRSAAKAAAWMLLAKLQEIEERHGRVRGDGRQANCPRPLDLDIIDFEGVVSDDPELLLPHPLAMEREFVVLPLLEVAPGHVLADGTAVADFACLCSQTASESQAQGMPQSTKPAGTLAVCSTPIGNLGDITARVVEALSTADLVLAEDTRVARRLLTHLNLRTQTVRCDENVIRGKSAGIIRRLQNGQRVAYISDAGTPGVSDPGMLLVAEARAAGIAVEVLPGASAVLAALVAAGFEARAFYFGGFLPRKQAKRLSVLKGLAGIDAALVFYESPHRVADALASIAEVFPEREAVLARELTKLHEEVLRKPALELAAEISERCAEQPLKGEAVLIVAPPPQESRPKRSHHDKYSHKNKAQPDAL
jgi:16S rRNA (cytidine1402-2'-O)-methyltransferase